MITTQPVSEATVFVAGEPSVYPLTGRKIRLDSMPTPNKVRIDKPEKIPLRKNQFTTQLIKVGVGFGEAQRYTPGKEEIRLPELITIPSKTLVAIPSPPRQILPPDVKADATHDIRYWGMEQGMHSYFIHALYEDHRGYLWIGGWGGGLARFDGTSMIDYRNPANHFPEEGVNHIGEDPEGFVWLSMRDRLIRFDGTTFRHYVDHPAMQDGVRNTLVDHKGQLWVVTEGHGLLRYEGEDTFTHFTAENGLPGNFVWNLAEDTAGNLWFTSENLLVRYDGEHFYHLPQEKDQEPLDIGPLVFDNEQRLWILTTAGLLRHEAEVGTVLFSMQKEIPYFNGTELSISPSGELWAASFNNGIFSFKDGAMIMYTREEGMSVNSVSTLLIGSQGQVWAGTHGGGLNKLNPVSFEYILPNLPGPSLWVNGIFEDRKGAFWLGTDGHGMLRYHEGDLYQYGAGQRLWYHPMELIVEDQAGGLWQGLGGEKSVTHWSGEYLTTLTEKQGLAQGGCTSMITDKRNRVWVGFQHGISIIDGNTITTFNEADNKKLFEVSGLVQGEGDDIWFCSVSGIGQIRYDSLYWHPYPDALEVGAYGQDFSPVHGLWIATYEGLYRFDESHFYRYGKKQGIEDIHVFDVKIDQEDNVWAATDFGIYRIYPDSSGSIGPSPRIEAYHFADGLHSETQHPKGLLISEDNELWISNSDGVCRLDLNNSGQEVSKEVAPTVYLNGLSINESDVHFMTDSVARLSGELLTDNIRFERAATLADYPREVSVPYRANHFTFNFSAFDWATPHKLKYQYRLLGQEPNWSSPVTNNTVDYRGLGHGTYTFEARAAGRAGVWGTPLRYTFTIRPPWWYSNWAYLCYGLVVLGILWTGYALVRRRFLLRNAYELEQAESLRLRELDTFKSRLFTNLTHEFRTPLTVILGMARQLRDKPGEALLASRLIERNGQSLLRLVNQLLDLSKLENNALKANLQRADIIPFLSFLTHSFQTYANGKNLAIRFVSAEDKLVMDFDAEHLQQIISNLISNALKFTAAGGVTVRAERVEDWLRIRVIDTGIGIAADEQANVFNRFYQVDGTHTRKGEGTGIGLAHTQELVRLQKGSISLKSRLGKGTVFIVDLPIRTEAPVATTNPIATSDTLWQEENTAEVAEPVLNRADQPIILVVEDNADVVFYIKSCLLPAYRVEVAFNGRIGAEKAMKIVPDIVISDVMMPEMDGFQLCELLKQDDKTSHIPFILLTAKADADSRLDGLARGADAYLAKPFEQRELNIRLKALLERQRRMANYFSAKESTPEHPVADEEMAAIAVENAFVVKLEAIVARRYHEENFNLSVLCKQVGMSRSQLFRKLKAVAEVSPSAFIRNYRLERARELLLQGDLTMAETAYAVGFREPAHFTKIFREAFGMPPSVYATQMDADGLS